MDNLDFTEEEIQRQLAVMGYRNIPVHKVHEVKQDVDELIQRGRGRSFSSPPQTNANESQAATSRPSPPAYTKEKVGHRYFEDTREGFYLHPGPWDYDRELPTTSQIRDYRQQQRNMDPSTQHLVDPGALSRLQVEPDQDDTLDPTLSDSYTSSADTQGRRFIKRIVLRKRKGKTLICDESFYSEDSALGLHRSLTSAGEQVATMYKTYHNQFVDESDDDKNSLNSSFWSDGEREADEEDEEKVEVERAIGEEDSKPADTAEESQQEASGEEKPELNEDNTSEESSEGGSDDDDDEDEDEDDEYDEEEGEVGETEEGEAEGEEGEEEQGQSGEADAEEEEEEDEEEDEKVGEEEEEEEEEENCSSSCDSPAPSQMTSGYGTYRPEEQDGGDYRDDHTITEFDQDSRGDLSETKEDEEDDRSLCSFSGFDIEPELDYSGTRPLSVSEDPEPEASVMCCDDDDDDGLHEEVNMKADEDQTDEERFEDQHAACENVTNATAEEKQHVTAVEDELLLDEKRLEDDCVDVEGLKQYERAEEETQDLKELQDKVESDQDESSSNKDIKFIDSKVKFSQTSFDKMCEEWEGNLRPKKDVASSLEERLADLNLSPSAQRDFEVESEDVTSQSDTQSSESDGVPMSAFESYIRGMTRPPRDGDIKPKHKAFIRPVMNQQPRKKTDPVAKYFQYKQLWDMFKLPGEQDRKAVRLEIKERLAYQPPPPKPRRVYLPNTYIVPTDKRRSALRWEIRNDLAHGLVPYKYSHRF